MYVYSLQVENMHFTIRKNYHFTSPLLVTPLIAVSGEQVRSDIFDKLSSTALKKIHKSWIKTNRFFKSTVYAPLI
jgi:hypothetical protein